MYEHGDSDALDAAVGGDAGALRALLERHGQPIWNEINAEIGKRWQSLVDADDVLQITYVEAFLQICGLTARDEAGFVAWLRRIARNNLQDAIKELRRQKRPDPARRVHAPAGEDSYVALVNVLGETSTTPSRDVGAREAAGIIGTMLARLPADYRAVIRLYDLEGQEIAVVAARLGRSPGAVHMLRARAHDRLRELLGAETNFFTQTA